MLRLQLYVHGSEVVYQLFFPLRADNDARDERSGKLPRKRKPSDRKVCGFGHLSQRSENPGESFQVYGREVKRTAPGIRRSLFVEIELSRKQTSCEWTPRKDCNALGLAERDDFTFDISSGER